MKNATATKQQTKCEGCPYLKKCTLAFCIVKEAKPENIIKFHPKELDRLYTMFHN